MHMVWHQMALDNLAFFLPGQRVEDRTQLPARLAEYGLPTPFGHENYVVLFVVCQSVRFYSHMICPVRLFGSQTLFGLPKGVCGF